MPRKTAPKLGSDTYRRDVWFDSTITKGSEEKELQMHTWTTQMCRDLCKHLGTPPVAARHIRAGVESVYQTSDLGNGYSIWDNNLTVSEEERQRRGNVITDNGRIKLISPAEGTLLPLILAMYLLVSNKMYGEKLNGEVYQQRLHEGAEWLPEWYRKHAKGAPLMGTPSRQLLESAERFMRGPMGKWKAMEWYQKVPESAPPSQALQTRDPNTVMKEAPPKASDTKKRSKSSSSPTNKGDNSIPAAADLSSTHLDGEENEEVPIFDTCDDVRKKLNESLKYTTQVKLSRELNELLPTSSVSSRQLGSFLKFKGPQAGAHSIAFYAGYVYFEKIRVKEDKKKTAKREKMEEKWSKVEDRGWQTSGSRLGGFPRIGSHNAHLTCLQGERSRLDQYGEPQISGERTGGAILRKKPRK